MRTELDVNSLCHLFRDGPRGISFKVIKDNLVRKDGYRARHLVIEVPESYTRTWQTCKIEVQLHTALQNAFNRISRAWLYKSGRNLPDPLRLEFQKFSEQLKELDIVASKLQQTLFESAEGSRDEDELTPLAYKVIVQEVFNEEATEEEADWYTLFYRRCGCETCGQLRRFFRRQDVHKSYSEVHSLIEDDSVWSTIVGSKQKFWHIYGTKPKEAQLILETLFKQGAVPHH